MRGKMPLPFDILYWNSDATRMPAANHSFYLRNCYLDNKLTKGEMEIAGVTLDLHKVKVPVYNLATRRGSHRAGKIGAVRFAIFRRPGEIRAGRLRPYRRRDQSACEAKISILDRRESRRAPASTTGARRQPSTRAPGGPTGWSGSRARIPKRCRRARSAAASLSRLEDAPGSYVKVKSWELIARHDASFTGTFR